MPNFVCTKDVESKRLTSSRKSAMHPNHFNILLPMFLMTNCFSIIHNI